MKGKDFITSQFVCVGITADGGYRIYDTGDGSLATYAEVHVLALLQAGLDILLLNRDGTMQLPYPCKISFDKLGGGSDTFAIVRLLSDNLDCTGWAFVHSQNAGHWVRFSNIPNTMGSMSLMVIKDNGNPIFGFDGTNKSLEVDFRVEASSYMQYK